MNKLPLGCTYPDCEKMECPDFDSELDVILIEECGCFDSLRNGESLPDCCLSADLEPALPDIWPEDGESEGILEREIKALCDAKCDHSCVKPGCCWEFSLVSHQERAHEPVQKQPDGWMADHVAIGLTAMLL